MGQSRKTEKTHQCAEPECRATCPEEFEFCRTHAWTQTAVPLAVSQKCGPGTIFLQKNTHDGLLKGIIGPGRNKMPTVTLSHQLKISKPDGTPIFNRQPTLAEFRSAYRNFVPDGYRMALIFPPPEKMRENPSFEPILELVTVAVREDAGETPEETPDEGGLIL